MTDSTEAAAVRDDLIAIADRAYHAAIDARPIRDAYAEIADAVLAAGWRPPTSEAQA